jgi:hypothetical protein
MGRCTAEKLQRILASSVFSQHAKLNMADFVLYLPVCFDLRCRMVELHSKVSQSRTPTTRHGGSPRRGINSRDKFPVSPQGCTSKPTPIWDEQGWGGIPGRGAGCRAERGYRRHRKSNPKTLAANYANRHESPGLKEQKRTADQTDSRGSGKIGIPGDPGIGKGNPRS